MYVALIVIVTAIAFAALSGGLALGLHLFAQRWSERKRIVWASGIAGFLPMGLPFAGFLLNGADYSAAGAQDFALGFLALLILTLLISATLCLPAAWFVTVRLARSDRREENAREEIGAPDGEAAPLIGPAG